ncbi:prenyltransferase/squalene oxidase repeat-containing protein [Saccharicrinis aurantiacus]|uniref:delta-aminolevulinic acid dehydratase n=1 Tax=Saccharicrinis aurantiacus TaxID=1849719 RepID=UPI0008399339|nr:delta-aminolevulinic acid dehydratase [Saccharicrinis aurantiacus]
MTKLDSNIAFDKLKDWCIAEGFKGWDPYDGLNSKLFQSVPTKNSRFFRLAWIQFFKRSPINFRKIALVPKGYNPKALALFMMGDCKRYECEQNDGLKKQIYFFADKLIELQTKRYSGSCWGYNFDWQARAFFQPKGTPTVVATSFIANAFLDAYELFKEKQFLDIAISASKFILFDLNKTFDNDGDFCFSYSPEDKSQVYNASLLGSRLLARVYYYTKEVLLKNEAEKSIRYCIKAQKKSGAWGYGTLPYHQWIDNFHTGYNLECIADFQKYTGINTYQENINRGLKYYLITFFTNEGIPKYYSNSIYPIDIHAPAQLVATLYKLGKLKEHAELVNKVLNWTIKNMLDKKGYFYFQKTKHYTTKIPYMRWAQAWMYYALSFYINQFSQDDTPND